MNSLSYAKRKKVYVGRLIGATRKDERSGQKSVGDEERPERTGLHEETSLLGDSLREKLSSDDVRSRFEFRRNSRENRMTRQIIFYSDNRKNLQIICNAQSFK